MKTEDLIDALAAGIEPVRPARLDPALLAWAGGAAAVAVILLLGARSDLTQALQAPTPWLKAIYTAALA
ncbi:NrsF family protein, partial [Brevundimonas sp.]